MEPTSASADREEEEDAAREELALEDDDVRVVAARKALVPVLTPDMLEPDEPEPPVSMAGVPEEEELLLPAVDCTIISPPEDDPPDDPPPPDRPPRPRPLRLPRRTGAISDT